MQTRPFLAALILLVAPLLLYASQRDVGLEQAITEALQRCPHYTVFDDVAVAVSDGVATLTGDITSAAKRDGIADAVRRIAGVRRVVDRLAVLPASPQDTELRQKAARAIYGHPSFWRYAALPSPPIHIVVRDGTVRLTGTVTSDIERALARSLVAGAGAASVDNQLLVR